MKILVVDDSASIRILTVSILEDMGHDYLEADSGEKAIELIESSDQLPDLVILDINMPGIDGYDTGIRLKQMAGEHHLPIIFLTGSKDSDVQARCLAIGEDYIAKPFSTDMISIKVNAHLRVSQLTRSMSAANLELKRHHQLVKMEHDIVENIFSNHFQKQIHHSSNLQYHLSPVSIFNGDVLLTAMGPAGNMYLAIGDVTGHGLPAAVGAIPVYSNFRAMAHKGLTIGVIASEMNYALRNLMPDNMMLAATLLEINASATEITVWSGGMPKMIIDDGNGNIKQFIEARHPPLSCLEAHEFSQSVDVYTINEGDRIYLYTDGVEESRNASNEMFGEERLLGLFDGSSLDMFGKIIEQLDSFTAGSEQDDDITLVEFACQPNVDYQTAVSEQGPDIHYLPWQLQFDLGPDEFRDCDPIPQIIKLLGSAPGLDVHQDLISTILAELYSNSLEHGLLKLDSTMKHDEDGFFEYYQQRKKGLASLSEGSIQIQIEFKPRVDTGIIDITLTDSGDGFDFENIADRDDDNDDDSFGRGQAIAVQLCESITYSLGGRRVNVVYRLDR